MIDRARFIRCLLGLMVVGSLLAPALGHAGGLRTQLVAYPGYDAQWQRSAGLEGHGLVLEKRDPNAPPDGVAAAVLTGVENQQIAELGFDRRTDGACGDHLYWKITTSLGEVIRFSCAIGVTTPIAGSAEWVRVRFPAATGLRVEKASVILHMPPGLAGGATLDNLAFNGTLIGKPGKN